MSAALLAFLALPADPGLATDDLPSIPPLVARGGDEDTEPKSFVVSGLYRTAGTPGLGFRFATDGEREFCAVYDAGDGTPVFLSDGREALVYDFPDSKVLRLPARVVITLDRPPGAEKGLHFNATVRGETHRSETPVGGGSSFRIDRHIAAIGTRMRRTKDPFGDLIYEMGDGSGNSDTLRLTPGDPTRFGFLATRAKDRAVTTIRCDASQIGGTVPDSALACPDVAELKKAVQITEVTPDSADYPRLFTAPGWWVKLRYAARGKYESVPPGAADANTLRQKDQELGRRYRAALSRQGFRFGPPLPAPVKANRPPGSKVSG